MSQQAKEYLEDRVFYDPETKEVLCTIDVLASIMEMYCKTKNDVIKDNDKKIC